MDRILDCVFTNYRSYPCYLLGEEYYIKNFIETDTDQPSPIHQAILHHEIDKLDLQQINTLNKNGESPVLAALRLKNRRVALDIIKVLKGGNPDMTLSDIDGTAPIHEISSCEKDDQVNLEILQEVLELGGDVHARNGFGQTPLHVAGSLSVAAVLVRRGGDVNARDHSGNTVLHRQVINEEIVRFLVRKGALVNVRNIHGCTPIDESVFYSVYPTLEFLVLQAGGDVNFGRKTPLIITSMFYVEDTVRDFVLAHSNLLNVLRFVSFNQQTVDLVINFWRYMENNEKLLSSHLIRVLRLVKSTRRLNRVNCATLILSFFLRHMSKISLSLTKIILEKFLKTFGYSLLNFYLKTCDYPNLTEEKLQETVILLLSVGETLNYSDLVVIFNQYGDCELLHYLLNNRIVGKIENLPIFLRVICDVNMDLTFMMKNMTSKVNVSNLFDIYNLARYCTLPEKLAANLRKSQYCFMTFMGPTLIGSKFFEDLERVGEKNKLPPLVELSRNKSRLYLSQKYDLKSSKDLNMILERLCLPQIVKKMISFDFPLYFYLRAPPQYLRPKQIYM